MISIILIIVAAISNAMMDTLDHNFDNSVFRNLDENFWRKSKGYLNKYKERVKENGRKYPEFISGITDTFSDAWHIVKFCLILCIVIGFSIEKDFCIYDPIIYLIIWGAIFKGSCMFLTINSDE